MLLSSGCYGLPWCVYINDLFTKNKINTSWYEIISNSICVKIRSISNVSSLWHCVNALINRDGAEICPFRQIKDKCKYEKYFNLFVLFIQWWILLEWLFFPFFSVFPILKIPLNAFFQFRCFISFFLFQIFYFYFILYYYSVSDVLSLIWHGEDDCGFIMVEWMPATGNTGK